MDLEPPPPRSPLSNQAPVKLYELRRDRLLGDLSAYFQSPCPPDGVTHDYSIWKCSETGLEFAHPPHAGNLVFYHWVGGFPSYYPQTRWEYARVLARIKQLGAQSVNLLDVGCGDGNFLHEARSAGITNCFGLDFNQAAVEKCSQAGFSAFCGSISDAVARGIIRQHDFSVVTSFHCLEHVEKPVFFVEELLKTLAPAGRIFISTPASPMSFEASWFDVMNHPPHHLTRWNLRSYVKLAEILDLQIRFYFPHVSFIPQTVQAMKLKALGPRARTIQLLPKLLSPGCFWEFQKTFWRMWQRSRHDPWGGADVICVELQRK